MLDKEREYYSDTIHYIAGVDEAGRGPLAGPVVAAAVVLPPDFQSEEINDSKQLTEKKREALYDLIIENAIAYSINFASADEIDVINIYEATRKTMVKCLMEIKGKYDLVITDAMPIKNLHVPVIPMVKGDAQCLNIAAASILAKVTRDRWLKDLDAKYPEYGFAKHKGYGTKLHLEALEKYGPIDHIHRKTFGPVKRYYFVQETLF
ncbi:MAG: ribonuclease HII [Bacilli bacterium]|nr:ribonuclease HII [Bacilli bacterium]